MTRPRRRKRPQPLASTQSPTERGIILALRGLVEAHPERRLVAAYGPDARGFVGWVVTRSTWIRDVGPLDDVPGTPLYRHHRHGVDVASLDDAVSAIGA